MNRIRSEDENEVAAKQLPETARIKPVRFADNQAVLRKDLHENHSSCGRDERICMRGTRRADSENNERFIINDVWVQLEELCRGGDQQHHRNISK